MTQHTHGYRDIPHKDRAGIHTGDGTQDADRRKASFPYAGGGNGVFRHEAGTPGLSEARWWQDIGYLLASFVTEAMDFPRNLVRRIRYGKPDYFRQKRIGQAMLGKVHAQRTRRLWHQGGRRGNAVYTAVVLCLAMLLIMAGVFLWMGLFI